MRATLLLLIVIQALSCTRKDTSANESLEADTVLVLETPPPIDPHRTGPLDCTEDQSEKIYTYLDRSGAPEDLFTLIFKCDGDSLTGKLLGPLPMGEHGYAFFRADLTGIQVDSLQNVEFEYEHGKLYDKQITLDNYLDNLDKFDVGRSRAVILLKGRNYGDSLVFTCSSDYDDCFAPRMKFLPKN